MLLSVSVWAGHFQGMAGATRDLLHWFSALIALPAIVYAGRPFLRERAVGAEGSAHQHGRSDLAGRHPGRRHEPCETIRGGEHAYFDSAVTLLFFLLIGRYLDRQARGRARSAAERLLALGAGAVTVLLPDGTRKPLPAERVAPGMTVLVAAGGARGRRRHRRRRRLRRGPGADHRGERACVGQGR